ncbi:RICIN domain-containing protein [Pseudomonas chlororaphis]|nr:RICIN domain-containing protein [Pseudomonas chlororaphis]
MKKSTKTSEPATPDQALEDGPSRGGSVSAGSQRIFTALNSGNSFLFLRNTLTDPLIRITSIAGPFYLWGLTYSDLKKAYKIRNATADRIITASDSKDEVFAGVDNGDDRQFWKITDAGGEYKYIESLAFSGKVLSVEGASAADNTQVLCLERTGANSQKFKVVL